MSMRAKPAYRDRDETEVAVLDVLADRQEEGLSVFELRSQVDVDIDTLEGALAALKKDDLIRVIDDRDRTVFVVADGVVGPIDPETDQSMLEALRRRLPL
jgi:DNA-binding transcriptional ArsR family regulator